MRIHIMTAAGADIVRAVNYASARTGGSVDMIRWDQYGSRSHTRAVDIVLSGNARHRSQADRTAYAATYDQWGWFLAFLFTVDPDIKAGPYRDESDFHKQTHGTFTVGPWWECCVSAIGPVCEHMRQADTDDTEGTN